MPFNFQNEVQYEMMQPVSHGGASKATSEHSYEVPIVTKKTWLKL